MIKLLLYKFWETPSGVFAIIRVTVHNCVHR